MNCLKRTLLRSLLKKPAPDHIPRTGESAKSIDCNVVYFRAKDESWVLLCKEMYRNGVVGKYWEDEKVAEEVCVPFNYIDDYAVDITHFLGIYDLRYKSLSQYFLEGVVPVDRIKIAIGKVQQFLFNRKELVRSERIETLKLILEKTLDERNYQLNPVSMLNILYTQKWVYHPDKERQIRYNDLLLSSLVETGDLRREANGFCLTSKALVSISQYEDDQRRHRENISQAKAMKWLTLALILVGLCQAGVTLLEYLDRK